MSLIEIEQCFTTLKDDYNARLESLTTLAKQYLNQKIIELFTEDHDDNLDSISWTQYYTPSWDDGDIYEFVVNDLEWEGNLSWNEMKNQTFFPQYQEINKFIQNNPEIMECMFGDYQRITIAKETPDVFVLEDYYDN